MENNKKEIFVDGSGKDIEITKDDFKLAQSNTKVYDTKIKGKPTTFFKDAMKRFIKSKPAVVGGAIVGILVLAAIIVPLCTPDEGVYNTDPFSGGGTMLESNLTPKLFPAGTGFWDGTLKRTHVVYDNENEKPAGYNEGCYFGIKTYEEVVDATSEFGTGGYVNIYATNLDQDANFYSQNYEYNLDGTVNYTLSFDIADIEKPSYTYYGYRVSLYDGTNHYYLVGDENSYVRDEGRQNIDIYSTLIENGYSFDEPLTARIYFDVEDRPDSTGFMNLRSVSLTTNEADAEKKSLFEDMSFKDGNEVMLRQASELNFWTGDFGKIANGVNITYCDFTYDQYEDVYGERGATYSSREINVFVAQGLIETNFEDTGTEATTDPEILAKRFVVNQESDCPIIQVVAQIGDATSSGGGRYDGYSLNVKVLNYKALGYDSMPSFIFGTNGQSRDYFKLICTGMRFSFLLAIGVSAVNIAIGLCWGAISGYFGGWVDISMERFCDIVGSLPLTVVITLCILYGQEWNWGNLSDVLALMVALFLTGWMGVARRTRTQFYRFKGREYVLASRTLGAKDSRLIFRHILPNSMGTIITGSILMIPSVVYTETSIAYLGLGLSGQVMLGVILAEANTYYRGDKAFLLYIPTVIMCLLLVSFNLFGNGLRDAFNPQLKGGE